MKEEFLLIGVPSASIVNAIAFFASEMSEVRDGKRPTSWFSIKEPRSVVSEHVLFIVFIPLTRLEMEPEVDWKAWVVQ
jgi:hypothetical protein